MLFSLTIVAFLSTAHAGKSEDAVLLLSRFPIGSVPELPEVLDAVDRLAEHSSADDLPLLESLVTHETGAVRSSAQSAVARIRARHGLPVVAKSASSKAEFLASLTNDE